MNYIDNIKRIRNDKRVSQTDMAEKLGIAQNNYGRIERGLTELTVDRIYRIAEILEVAVTELLGISITQPIDNSNEIGKFLKENEELKEKVEYLSSQIKDLKLKATKLDNLETYLSERLQKNLVDAKSIHEDFTDSEDYYYQVENQEFISSINDEHERFNANAFIVFSEHRDFYRTIIDDLGIVSDSKIILAWKRFNYIYPLSFTIKDFMNNVNGIVQGQGAVELMLLMIDDRANDGKYKYYPREIELSKKSIYKIY